MALTLTDHKKILHEIYYDPLHPAGFGTVEKLYDAVKRKISKTKITNWLLSQETYTRHKPRHIHFKRRHYLIDNIDDLWESDLIVLNDELMKKHNENNGYIICKFFLFLFNLYIRKYLYLFNFCSGN